MDSWQRKEAPGWVETRLRRMQIGVGFREPVNWRRVAGVVSLSGLMAAFSMAVFTIRLVLAGTATAATGLSVSPDQSPAASGWSIQPTPNPTGAFGSSLHGVSCTAGSFCTAVGNYTNGDGATLTLAERWDGASWSIQPTRNPKANNPVLSQVSCTSGRACIAVGSDGNDGEATDMGALAERWNGTSWSIDRDANFEPDVFAGVSCTSGRACTAVGSQLTMNGDKIVTLAERWNGTRWSLKRTPNPTGSTNIELVGVSCTSGSACTAVGTYRNRAEQTVPLAERWNGSRWSIQPTSKPAGSTDTELNGVSCTSGRACTAVGYHTTRTQKTVPLAERWNGAKWSIQPTPNPTGATRSYLLAVSCISSRVCSATGSLAERWNGTNWSIQPTSVPAGSTSIELDGVSCTSGRACTAVGAYSPGSSPNLTLAESWNGMS